MKILYHFAGLVKPYYWSTMKLSALSTVDRRSPVPVFASIEDATRAGNQLHYVSDPAIYDNIHHPQHTQWLIEHPTLGGGDCDDSASWWCRAVYLLVDRVWFSFLTWRKDKKSLSHAICVFRQGTTYYHVGNWYRNKPQVCPDAKTPVDAAAFFATQIKGVQVEGAAAIRVRGYEADDSLLFGDVQSKVFP
jgi:hypothetical protein